MDRRRRTKGQRLIPAALTALAAASAAQEPAPPPEGDAADELVELEALSLDELMDLEVSIASRSKQRISEVPAAVYVLTGDEIRRAGHTSIPEALRMVPGFYVSHWTGGAWDVTSRGFGPGVSLTNQAFLNQLLVLVDGVVVYTPLFPGVWWPLQDLPLEDVERIEVVRGPGGILWGANAQHGVVHVITKRAGATQGWRVSGRAGNEDRLAGARYGGELSNGGHWRAWTRYHEYDTPDDPFLDLSQEWWIGSAGFRSDWEDDGRQLSFWARAYQHERDQIGFDLSTFVPIPVVDETQGFQASLSVEDPETRTRFQSWFATDQQALPTLADFAVDQLDLELQRELDGPYESTLTVGGGYRLTHHAHVGDDPFFYALDPEEATRHLFRLFGLGRTELRDDLELTLGVSAEHNDYTQFEVQPTARLAWWPKEDLMAWASITRAVRTPSIEEHDLTSTSAFAGDDGFRSEVLVAYEAGVRALLSDVVSLDVALFYNDYDELHVVADDPSTGGSVLTNRGEGHAYGIEVAADVRPTTRWSIRSAYALQLGEYEDAETGEDLGTDDYHPEHRASLRSYYDLGERWELDGGLYLVHGLDDTYDIAEYLRADVRLGWRPRDDLELYVGAQGLDEPTRSEFDEFDNRRRAFYVGATWRPD